MTDCLNCSKIFSGKCKQCPGHLAEPAAWKYKIDRHVHHMARVAWRLQPDRSRLLETENIMASLQDTTFEPTHEIQSRHALSYPTITFKSVPACKLAPGSVPIRISEVKQRNVKQLTTIHSANLWGASFHQQVSIGQPGRPPALHDARRVSCGIQAAHSKKQKAEGSNPSEYIPARVLLFLPVHGAGKIFFFRHNTTFNTCADYNYARMI